MALGRQLSGYDLRRLLDSRWPPTISTSTPLAQLCLRALGDQEIDVDRDDIIITLLLNAWPGAAALNDEEIGSLATRVPPEYP